MRVAVALVLAIVFLSLAWGNEESDEIHYTNSWAVHMDNNDLDGVNELAVKHGFTNLGQIGSLPGYFHFVKNSFTRRSKRSLDNHTELLLAEPRVKWVKQQIVLERSKRNIIPDHEDEERDKRDMTVTIRDPFFKDQWYLQNIGQSSGPAGLDINILPVWGQGYSGQGVVVSILDDGVDHNHPDLKRNYDPDASFDFNDFDPDPKPRSKDPLNCHGTKCAGEVAAEANNGVCGVGVSFNASIGGIRMLDGKATDTIEGSSLSYRSDYIDIYTCCWGPKDDGKRFGKPGFLASKALTIGVERGRGGKGNIYVWATGNGGLTDDDCNCDGYTTSIYTVSIGAISDHGLSTYYSESCASTLAVTFSGASHREADENKIITTGLDHKCTKAFKGTSSAAPLASGMLALVLEANPNLTWRDVQHVIVETSQKTSPLDEGWKKNGAGKEYNHKFGFGKLDATRMVERAKDWENVPKQRVCYGAKHNTSRNIPSSGILIATANTSACEVTTSEIRHLEHVQVVISLEHRHRGQLSITLISPTGTRSELLKTRRNDHSAEGLKDWVFMTVHCWGEDPRGSWTLIVTDNDRNTREHHVIKAKQGDLEDVTRVVMDDSEKQGPWDANQINEYESTKQAPPENHPPHDHILKGIENTVGELVKGNKFTELAKRKKYRHPGAKGFVGNKSHNKTGHAQYRHKSEKHRSKNNDKHGAKTKLKNYKSGNNKHKDLESQTEEKSKKVNKNRTLKHSQKKRKYHKHKYKLNKNYTPKHTVGQDKDRALSGSERKPLLVDGSLEIPVDRPLGARIAVQALMNPYFEISSSRIVLPKKYQRFTGEVDIKMKLFSDGKKERSGQDDNGRKSSFLRGQGQGQYTNHVEGVSDIVKQKEEINNLMHDFETQPFRIPGKVIKLLEATRLKTEVDTIPVGIPEVIRANKVKDDGNLYLNLLNSIQSVRQGSKRNSSSKDINERIDVLTDEKPYVYQNTTDLRKGDSRINGGGSNFNGSNFTESNITGSNFNGSNLTGSNTIASNVTGSSSTGNETPGSDFNGVLQDNGKIISMSEKQSKAGNENEAVSPDDVPIIFYDADKNQFSEVRKINESDPMSQETGNNITETGSKGIGKAGDKFWDEISWVSGSSGVAIEDRMDCHDGTGFSTKCQITENKNDLFSQTTGESNKDAGKSNDVDDGNDDSDGNDAHVTDDAIGFLKPQGSRGLQSSSKMDPPKDGDEGKLAYLLSTEKYQDVIGGPSKEMGLKPLNESRPLNISHSKDQNLPARVNISTGPVQAKGPKTLQTPIKHQDVPTRPSLNNGPSQTFDQKDQNNPGPTSSNKEMKIDVSELEPLDKFTNKDFAALENSLDKQVARLEKFKDEDQTGSRFLQRVKEDIRSRNVDDLKFLEDELQKDTLDKKDGGRKENTVNNMDAFWGEPRDDLTDTDEDRDEDQEFHSLVRRRLSNSVSKRNLFHKELIRDSDKYGKENSGILKSWSLVLYGT